MVCSFVSLFLSRVLAYVVVDDDVVDLELGLVFVFFWVVRLVVVVSGCGYSSCSNTILVYVYWLILTAYILNLAGERKRENEYNIVMGFICYLLI